MFAPSTYTESEVLAGYLTLQLDGIRAAAHGLTDAQARETPCRSTLSVGGLLKHATYVMAGRARDRLSDSLDAAGAAIFAASFVMGDDETLEATLATFDAAREVYLADVRATDPGAAMTAPPAPWDGLVEPTPSVQRFELVHHVEELARHAGHADIIREQLDGAGALPLLMAVEGRPGNPFVQPWSPAT